MADVGDIYKLAAKFTQFGVEQVITRWFQLALGPGTAADLGSQWLIQLIPDILALISDEVTCTGIETINLSDPEDFYSVTGSLGTGSDTTDAMPQYIAYGLQFPSSDRRVRASTMRIPGVTDAAFVAGEVPASVQNLWDAVAADLVEEFGGVVALYDPVIYTPGNTRTSGAPLAVVMTNGFFSRITTQNSRKA